jgi:hypothetical protein
MNIEYLLGQLEVIEQQSHHSSLLIYKPSEDQESFYKRLCQTYLDVPTKQQVVLRDAVRRKAGVVNSLLGYIYECADRLQKTKNKRWLDIGLAAGSLRGDGPDFRDFYLALAELYVAAKSVGLKPSMAFDKIGGGVPKDFKSYAVVKSKLASSR